MFVFAVVVHARLASSSVDSSPSTRLAHAIVKTLTQQDIVKANAKIAGGTTLVDIRLVTGIDFPREPKESTRLPTHVGEFRIVNQ